MTPQLRPATEADLDALTGLLGQLFAIETDFPIDPERQRRGLALLFERPDALILVEDTTREAAVAFMQLRESIDCLIPRGGPSPRSTTATSPA